MISRQLVFVHNIAREPGGTTTVRIQILMAATSLGNTHPILTELTGSHSEGSTIP